jgi:hypothetical protein
MASSSASSSLSAPAGQDLAQIPSQQLTRTTWYYKSVAKSTASFVTNDQMAFVLSVIYPTETEVPATNRYMDRASLPAEGLATLGTIDGSHFATYLKLRSPSFFADSIVPVPRPGRLCPEYGRGLRDAKRVAAKHNEEVLGRFCHLMRVCATVSHARGQQPEQFLEALLAHLNCADAQFQQNRAAYQQDPLPVKWAKIYAALVRTTFRVLEKKAVAQLYNETWVDDAATKTEVLQTVQQESWIRFDKTVMKLVCRKR